MGDRPQWFPHQQAKPERNGGRCSPSRRRSAGCRAWPPSKRFCDRSTCPGPDGLNTQGRLSAATAWALKQLPEGNLSGELPRSHCPCPARGQDRPEPAGRTPSRTRCQTEKWWRALGILSGWSLDTLFQVENTGRGSCTARLPAPNAAIHHLMPP